MTSKEVQQLNGGLACVLEVVDDQQDRIALGQSAQQRRHSLERAPALDLHAAPVERSRAEQVGYGGHQRRCRARVRAQHVPEPGRGHSGNHRSESFHDGLEEQRPLGLVAAAAQDCRAVIGGLGGHELGQGRLADTRLAGDQDEAGCPACGAAPGHPQRLELSAAASQVRP